MNIKIDYVDTLARINQLEDEYNKILNELNKTNYMLSKIMTIINNNLSNLTTDLTYLSLNGC